MPIRRILGQSAAVEVPTSAPTGTGPAEVTSTAVAEDHGEHQATEQPSETHVATTEAASNLPASKVHSKFIRHLEKYQGLGYVVETAGDLLAPSILYVKSLFPESVVSSIKTADNYLDGVLTSVDGSVPESLLRTPTHA